MRWNKQKVKRRVLYSFAGLAVMAVVGLVTLVIAIWPTLPGLDILTDYRPRVPLRVYTSDGFLISEIGEERREVVKIENVPESLKQALLAAEDLHFYEHIGIDLKGLLRAAWANLRGKKQGASTITMQVARNFFLSPEQTLSRKFREILLSLKIEHHLSKDQILELYINQIFLGQRAHGFEVAAQTYFGKSLGDLSLAEIAVLAGLPKAPSSLNPIVNPRGAKRRQGYVLGRMLKVGFIDEAAYQAAMKEPLKTASGSVNLVHAEYVGEMARLIAVEKYGDQATRVGLKIITTITRAEQEAAYEALRQGVMNYDRRHSYRGPEKYLNLPDGEVSGREIDEEIIRARAGDERKPLDYGDLLLAVVIDASPEEVTVYRNGEFIKIAGNGLNFASAMLVANAPQSKRVRRGALVRIRNGGGNRGWELTQVPEVDAALVSIDTKTGAVRALVGGFDFNRSQFNNVTMARRQPGSSFKPFIYSASLEKKFAPGDLLDDAHLNYPAGVAGRDAWEPKNFDERFDGLMTMRDALVRSKNIPAIRVLEKITPAYAQGYIAKFGFAASNHPAYLTMALGAGVVSPWEMASAYAVFANGGYRVSPFVVKEIRDAKGNTLARFDPQVAGEGEPSVIDARNAWVMDSMLKDVVRRGTGSRARVLNRQDIAGKSGTTNDYGDAWFCGYHPTVAAVAWVGFPKPRNMGSGETGGTAALPMWINYMRAALANVSETSLPRPSGICSALADEGGYEDYHYCENPPPPLRDPSMSDLGLDIHIPPPAKAKGSYVPPAPVSQSRARRQSGEATAPIPQADPDEVNRLGGQGF